MITTTDPTHWIAGTLTDLRLHSWTLFLEDGTPIGHVVLTTAGWAVCWVDCSIATLRPHLGEAMDVVQSVMASMPQPIYHGEDLN